MKLISLNTFMKAPLTSACRHCRHYTPEGRRGGVCDLLSVPVQSQWKACALAVSPFEPYWENIEEEIELWKEQTVTLPDAAVSVSERNAGQLTGTALIAKFPAVSV
ncbi:hypothetical protein [Tychonema sp. LEGE 07203]|uniref:hypothetical protein n=1 Tax=Tychonema sp. LEGE 07203 TaxID=1828671 RepID=UPI001880D704|nr:hypothetical protein [Tychonema sp. LEGE 07203]MBE9095526.1 hypothetical protein [Tychonema sp. LEGE 07203]